MKNQVQRGDNITVTATAAVKAGEGVLMGNLFGIAAGDATIGDPLDLVTVGVFRMDKVEADAFTIGARAYWDEAAKLVTTDDDTGGNHEIGLAVIDAANPSGAVNVRLHG